MGGKTFEAADRGEQSPREQIEAKADMSLSKEEHDKFALKAKDLHDQMKDRERAHDAEEADAEAAAEESLKQVTRDEAQSDFWMQEPEDLAAIMDIMLTDDFGFQYMGRAEDHIKRNHMTKDGKIKASFAGLLGRNYGVASAYLAAKEAYLTEKDGLASAE